MSRRSDRARELRRAKSAVADRASSARKRGRGLVKAGSAAVRFRTGGWTAWLIASGWLLLVWFALWGSISPMLLITGLAATAVTLLVFPLPVIEFGFGLHPWRTFVLVVRFLGDVVMASVEVAWLAIRPGKGPQGAITTVQLRSTSDLVQTLTSLAVSLVPGSLIIEADPENRTLLIHVLDIEPDELPAFHRSVLDQEERILRALGSKSEIDALMGGEDDGGLAMHQGSVSLGSTVLLGRDGKELFDRQGRSIQGSALFDTENVPDNPEHELGPAESREKVPEPEPSHESELPTEPDDEEKAGDRP